jgi:hypothetical protein
VVAFRSAGGVRGSRARRVFLLMEGAARTNG